MVKKGRCRMRDFEVTKVKRAELGARGDRGMMRGRWGLPD